MVPSRLSPHPAARLAGSQAHHCPPGGRLVQHKAISSLLFAEGELAREELASCAQHLLSCQGPGETMFVPGGWWHTVMNLTTPTIAVTHNYASTPIFREVTHRNHRLAPRVRAGSTHAAELAMSVAVV